VSGNLWFTADHHFGHANIIDFCHRPFASVEDMNEGLIMRWNDRINPGDQVYVLGDLFWKGGLPIFKRLNGVIHLIEGSHDAEAKRPEIREHLAEIVWLKTLKTATFPRSWPITLCHYAMRTWPFSFHGGWHLFGHSHGRLSPYGKSFDVGVDTHDYYPYHMDEVIETMQSLSDNPTEE